MEQHRQKYYPFAKESLLNLRYFVVNEVEVENNMLRGEIIGIPERMNYLSIGDQRHEIIDIARWQMGPGGILRPR